MNMQGAALGLGGGSCEWIPHWSETKRDKVKENVQFYISAIIDLKKYKIHPGIPVKFEKVFVNNTAVTFCVKITTVC
jgi:hypothetical protein